MVGKLFVLCLLSIIAMTGCTNGQSNTDTSEPAGPTPITPPDEDFVTPTIDFEVDPQTVEQDALDYLIDEQSFLALIDDFLTVKTIPLNSPPVSYQQLSSLVGDFDTQIINCAVNGVINVTGYIREAGVISSGDLHGYEIGECIEKHGIAFSGSYLRRFLAGAELATSGKQPVIESMQADITYDNYATRHEEPARQVVLDGAARIERAPIDYPRRGTFDEEFISSEQLRVDYAVTDQQGHYLLQDLESSAYFDEELDAHTLALSTLIYSSHLQGGYYIHGAEVNDDSPWTSRFMLMGKDNSSVTINIDALNNVKYALDSDGDGEVDSQGTYSVFYYLDLGGAVF